MTTDHKRSQSMIQAANARSTPAKFEISSNNLLELLKESLVLAPLLASEKRDLISIQSHYELRRREIELNAQINIEMIREEYKERSMQIAMLDKNVQILIEAGQFEIASRIMSRMADILSNSPLKAAISFRQFICNNF